VAGRRQDGRAGGPRRYPVHHGGDETRLGKEPVGFLHAQRQHFRSRRPAPMSRRCCSIWASGGLGSRAPGASVAPENPTAADFQRVVDRQTDAQPYVYPTGLVEVPMSPLGDVASFRREKQKWTIGNFLAMIEKCVRWAIQNRAVFDLLTHPSIMYVEDPKFQSYELICDMVTRPAARPPSSDST